jgi:uncharacterized membrane protein YdbT with pleckstrin-like domain
MKDYDVNEIIWQDRMHTFLGMPLSFTKYTLTREKIMLETGFFNSKYEEVQLYRVLDISVSRPFGQKIFGLGTIYIKSSDKSMPDLYIRKVRYAMEVKDSINQLMEICRRRERVFMSENLDRGDVCR